jgi:anti-sigma factor RsiW
MNCIRNGHGPEWESKIALYAGGDLPPAEAVELERHLASCGECRSTVEGYAGVLDAVQEMHRGPVPQAAYSAVRARVLAELERPVPFWRRAWVYAVPVAVAALVILTLPNALRKPAGAPARTSYGSPTAASSKREAPATAPAEIAAHVGQAPGLRAGPPAGANQPRHPRPAQQADQPKPPELAAAPEAPGQVASVNESPTTADPLVIKMLTDDPDVIIYWIADSKGD